MTGTDVLADFDCALRNLAGNWRENMCITQLQRSLLLRSTGALDSCERRLVLRFPDGHKLELGFTVLQLRFRTAQLMLSSRCLGLRDVDRILGAEYLLVSRKELAFRHPSCGLHSVELKVRHIVRHQ